MTDITLKLTEAFNQHNSLYNALLGNLNTLTTAHTEEVSITLDAGHVRALTRILNAALANVEKHKAGKDYSLDIDLTGENALGKPAVTLTMNLKSLSYVTELLITGRLATEVADARKKKPFHD